MNCHASVNYVEPNVSAVGINSIHNTNNIDSWKHLDYYNRSPRLEDYCIALNIEVEVCSRDNIVSGDKKATNVLILQYRTDHTEDGKPGTVNFLGGTKVSTSDGKSTNYLTTHYADMYVGDLIDYGTTEMIGIKSIDIEYQKSCVPIINIVFTDVRGLSLFQPTELSRTDSYDGIRGLNVDNIAQSFFQCFFRVPMPKFTITLKGFYGKPVTYEVMCDKFVTKFNSSTGDFDVNTRFIGYSYSFLTDISMDALIAAPYSDYEGKDYWESKVKDGTFALWNREKTEKKPMPTLVEVMSDIDIVLASAYTESSTGLSDEEKNHTEQINLLTNIRSMYKNWYATLFNIVCAKYGEEHCFLYKEKGSDADDIRIMILMQMSDDRRIEDLSLDYETFPDSFKKLNADLHTAIEEYQSKDFNYKNLENVSLDFSDYQLMYLFNKLFISSDNKVVFNGFHRRNELPEEEVIETVFYSVEYKENIEQKREQHKNHVLETIYNDGVNQYIYCYSIAPNYRIIKDIINALQDDANSNVDEREEKKKNTALNNYIYSQMKWYPTIENFTRIMLAHLETLMHMMYTNISSMSGRTAEELGVTVGPDGICNDVNPNKDDIIPPFPRVSRNILGEDEIVKKEDTWVGEYQNGTRLFEEINLINGLLNGIDYVSTKAEDTAQMIAQMNAQQEEPLKTVINHPLTTFDFIIERSPYGSSDEICSEIEGYDFAGKVAIRMFTIMTLNHFSLTFASNWDGSVEKIAETEALNFKNLVRLTDSNFLSRLRNGEINTDFVISAITNSNTSENCPWGTDVLFSVGSVKANELWIDGYALNETYESGKPKNWAFPIQNVSFKDRKEYLSVINQNRNTTYDNDFAFAKECGSYTNYSSNNDKIGLGTLFISDNINYVKDILKDAADTSEECYSYLYNEISSRATVDRDRLSYYKQCFNTDSQWTRRVSVFNRLGSDSSPLKTSGYTIDGDGNFLLTVDDNGTPKAVTYEANGSRRSNLASEAVNGSVTSYTLTECFTNVSNSTAQTYDYSSSFLYKHYLYSDYALEFTYAGIKFNAWHLAALAGFRINHKPFREQEQVGYDHRANSKDFVYAPKLIILQMGVAILRYNLENGYVFGKNQNGSLKESDKVTKILSVIPGGGYGEASVFDYNFPARLKIVKYLADWLSRYGYLLDKLALNDTLSKIMIQGLTAQTQYTTAESAIEELSKTPYAIPSDLSVSLPFREIQETVNTMLGRSSSTNYNRYRFLLNENSETVKTLSSELLGVSVMINLSMFSISAFARGEKYNPITVDTARKYLDTFIGKLRVLYNIDTEVKDDSGRLVRTSKEPTKATEDIKKELYRYLKQVYDKWIPMNKEEDWTLESFFKNCEGVGHNFYFIDSFYNYIGDKVLINPKILSEKLKAFLAYKDVNTMMLGFMADIYAVNRCMLMSIQNFFDLNKYGSMEEMFTMKSFNEIDWRTESDLHKSPSFVVVYPYEPSKNLDIPNNEYNNDGFMLNDENETPIAIRTKTDKDGQYRIPAFGVSYGKQYQSFFKSININMESPVATQQSIQAKHYILQESAGTSPANKTVAAQDLFDIYSTQSYTCEVEMMGCAWVQPMMYFVLLNVPMFKGSYMIMKVTHSITPGNMVTKFTGCRMANVSTKFVENIFSDETPTEGVGKGDNGGFNVDRTTLADINNDCPYKVYPLYSVDGAGPDLSSELDRQVQQDDCHPTGNMSTQVNAYTYLSGHTVLDSICALVMNESGGLDELNEMLTATVIYNRYNNSKTFKADIFKHGQFDIVKAHDKFGSVTDNVREMVRNIFTQSPSWILSKYTQTTMTHTDNNKIHSHTDSKYFHKGDRIVEKSFGVEELTYLIGFGTIEEMQHKLNNPWVSDKAPVIMAQNAMSNGRYMSIYVGTYKNVDRQGKPKDEVAKSYWEPAATTNDTEKESLNVAFFNAIQKSCNSTPSISVELTKEEIAGSETNQMRIKASSKVANIFDMIVSTNEYLKYVKKIYWERGDNYGEDYSVEPESIVVELLESVPSEQRQIFIAPKHNGSEDGYSEQLPNTTNVKFLQTIAKRRAVLGNDTLLNKEVPQFKNDFSLLESWGPKSCDSIVSSMMPTLGGGGGNISGVENYPGLIHGNRNKKIEYIVIHYTTSSQSKKGQAKWTCEFFDSLRTDNDPKTKEASADFCVDDETIYQYNPDVDKYYCYHCGNGSNDTSDGGGTFFKKCTCSNSIGIEICSSFNGTLTRENYVPNNPGWYYTEAVLNNALNLTKFLMTKYNVPIDKVIRHFDVCGKLCPGIKGWNLAKLTDGSDNNEDQWIAFKNTLASMTGSTLTQATETNWSTAVKRMAEWYVTQVKTYDTGTTSHCDLTNDDVRHDCSGFVSACLRLFGVEGLQGGSEAFLGNDPAFANKLISKGFKKMTYSYEEVKPFDIIAVNQTVGSVHYHHVEIFAEKGNVGGPDKSYGWGKAKTALPANTGKSTDTRYPTPQNGKYQVIWRYNG